MAANKISDKVGEFKKCLRDLQRLSDTKRKAYRLQIFARNSQRLEREQHCLDTFIGDVVYFDRALLNCSFFLESETSHRYMNLM